MSEYIQHMKTKLLQVRIEPDKIIELKARADDLGMSVSEYVRYLFKMDQKTPESIDGVLLHATEIAKILTKYTDKNAVKIG